MKKFLTMMLVVLIMVTTTAYAAPVARDENVTVLVGYANSSYMKNSKASIASFRGTTQAEFDFINVAKVELPKSAVDGLKAAPGVKFVEPDYVAKAYAQTVPWGITKVKAPNVHSAGPKGAGIKVAVLDTGILVNHPDLQVVGGYDTTGKGSYTDDNGHGTHVAGTIAALDNTIGVIGVAPQAQLYAVKVLDRNGSGSYSNIIAGIQWAVNNNMKVINMSLGGDQGSAALEQACNAAYNAGVLVVAAAGNSGTASGANECIGYPARYASVIAVGAITSANTRSSFSSTGSTLEIVAPGSDIYSTTYNGGYGTMSGTSMACPHVAGVAALVWSAKPTMTNVQLRNVLKTTADDLWHDSWRYGSGLVNAFAAYQYINGDDPQPPPPPPPTNLNVTITTNYAYYYMYETMQMTVTVRDQNGALVPNAAVTLRVQTASGYLRQGSAETDATGSITFLYTISPLDGRGNYTITAQAQKGSASGIGTKYVWVY